MSVQKPGSNETKEGTNLRLKQAIQMLIEYVLANKCHLPLKDFQNDSNPPVKAEATYRTADISDDISELPFASEFQDHSE